VCSEQGIIKVYQNYSNQSRRFKDIDSQT